MRQEIIKERNMIETSTENIHHTRTTRIASSPPTYASTNWLNARLCVVHFMSWSVVYLFFKLIHKHIFALLLLFKKYNLNDDIFTRLLYYFYLFIYSKVKRPFPLFHSELFI